MAAMTQPLGLRAVFQDNAETWSVRVGEAGQHDRRKAALWYYGVPTLGALVLVVVHVRVHGVGQLLSGVAVFTALLYGLLILIFNTGVTLRKDGNALESAHDIRRVVADLRANVTYSALVAITLAIVLVAAAASGESAKGLPWWWAPVLAWLFVHLGLNLMTILGRVRTAFNYITR
jgi:hypothetical protein